MISILIGWSKEGETMKMVIPKVSDRSIGTKLIKREYLYALADKIAIQLKGVALTQSEADYLMSVVQNRVRANDTPKTS